MNFGLTKEQVEFRDKVRDFAEREVKPIASYNDENEIFDVEELVTSYIEAAIYDDNQAKQKEDK